MIDAYALDPERSSNIHASIDLGSHTARLLVACWEAGRLRSLLRKRTYIRLAQDFESAESGTLKQAGIERALKALGQFQSDIERHHAKRTRTVATGVVRAATNRIPFIDLVQERTGITAEVITGEEEARLTGLGVRHGLGLEGREFTAFDLGGGTTEFLIVPRQGHPRALSLALGAMIMTQRYLLSDPPEAAEIESLRRETRGLLMRALPQGLRGTLLVGTGGTVTTLAAMVHGVQVRAISPEGMNGLLLRAEELDELLGRMRRVSVSEREAMVGLDRGRADVIVAGSVAVREILNFFHSSEMMVSLSDLLEGALLDMLGVSLET